MSTIEKTIDVGVPIAVAYNQWTQFEEFPQFMEGLTDVRQIDDTHLHWRANIGGREREWDSEITEQIPDQLISWQATSGSQNSGTITFRPIDEHSCRIMLHLDYKPEGPVENLGDLLGIVSRRVEADLRRFKKFIESRKVETGSWRGEVHGEK